jgi:ABC-2 type transport system ATP-binding protein
MGINSGRSGRAGGILLASGAAVTATATATPTDDIIEVQGLRKRYTPDAPEAVQGIDFAVRRGEVFGLLGPNGAGKTTTMRMLAGFITPSAGTASICGHDVIEDPLGAKAALGYLPEGAPVYGEMTVGAFLDFIADLRRLDGVQRRERLAHVIERLQLRAVLGQSIETLSKGFRHRVGLAQAIVHDPPVLILDEPTAGLDVLASRFLRDFVRAERDRGKAVLFSTHYLAEAELLCDRIGLLHRGRLLAEGTPAALRAKAGGAPSLEDAFLRLVGDEDRPAPAAVDATGAAAR